MQARAARQRESDRKAALAVADSDPAGDPLVCEGDSSDEEQESLAKKRDRARAQSKQPKPVGGAAKSVPDDDSSDAGDALRPHVV